jgi:transcriptional regulator with XRE-family HTH domain
MPEMIGTKLKQAREARDLTVEQASASTRIRPHYLQALERDDLSAIPSAAQARGFLRLYAEFLGLNADQLVAGARQLESAPAAAAPELATASTQKSAPAAEPAQPSFLASLLERFTRRPDSSASNAAMPPTTGQASTPEPAPFVPARFTEELPAEPSSLAEQPAPAEELEPAAASVQTRKSKSGNTTPVKTASKAVRSSGSRTKAGEKKKIT